MRDDIHRSAPVPRSFRTLMKVCLNDASFHAEGPVRAERAIIKLLVDEIGPNCAQRIADAVAAGDGDLFGRTDHLNKAMAEGECSELILVAVANAKAGRGASEAILDAGFEQVASLVRGMEAYALSDPCNPPEECREMRDRIEDSIRAAEPNIKKAIEKLVRGERPALPPSPHGRLRLDEELL